ncbi:trypsin-like peptidase domain-containing protein [Embleya sp. NPDC020886]|uniref:trypsin-like peptidase domain-containing protein n=1 Tax=Embleya sp. NPDC020886 TaxID=3363980 RepID=UPI00379CDA15
MFGDDDERLIAARLDDAIVGELVRIRIRDTYLGTGFLIAGDTVLTCAHVVHGHSTGLSVALAGTWIEVDVVRSIPPETPGGIHPFPDLAELRLRTPVESIGVWLGERPPLRGDEVAAYGYSRESLEGLSLPETLDLEVAGPSGRFTRVKSDQVLRGLSGSPVLDPRTGRVCGVLKSSRDVDDERGGWLIPIGAVAAHLPESVRRNADAHRPGTRWRDIAVLLDARQQRLFRRPRERRRTGERPATPARLLAGDVMPFVPRPEVDALYAWCTGEPELALRLLHAPGGAGKTRLAAQLGLRLRNEGWNAGFVAPGAPADPAWQAELVAALAVRIPVLVVLDYAEGQVPDIAAFLAYLDDHLPEGSRLRILLLARSVEPLWQALSTSTGMPADADEKALTGRLDPGGSTSLATLAFDTFAAHLDCPWLRAPRTLDARAAAADSPLSVLALALDAVLTMRQGDTWIETDDPLTRICTHELHAWSSVLKGQLPVGSVLTGTLGTLVSEGLLLVPTLAPGRDPDALTELLLRVCRAAFARTPEPDVAAVYTCLRTLYPGEDEGVAPMEPDRIGEILMRRVFTSTVSSGNVVGYLAAILETPDAAPIGARVATAARTIEVFARARGCTGTGRIEAHDAYRRMDAALGAAAADNPAVVLPALVVAGEALPHVEPLVALMTPLLETCDPAVLGAVEERLPEYPSGLSAAAAVTFRRLLGPGSATLTVPAQAERLRLLSRFALRLGDLDTPGSGEDALDAAREAAALADDLYRRTGRYAGEYAAVLNNLALLLHRGGDLGTALAHAADAVERYRGLLAEAEATGDDVLCSRRRLDEAAALSTLVSLRLADGQVAAAVEEASRAVTLCMRARPGARHDDTFVTCLEVLIEARFATGEGAVTAATRLVEVLRILAERQPGRYAARLPEGLHTLARALVRADRERDAYPVMREAVALRTALPTEASQRVMTQRADRQYALLRALAQLAGRHREFESEQRIWLARLPAEHDHDA